MRGGGVTLNENSAKANSNIDSNYPKLKDQKYATLESNNKESTNPKSKKQESKSQDSINLECKAFYESILYYLRESQTNNNIHFVILSDTIDFYIIEAKEYGQFSKDKKIQRFFNNCDRKEGSNPTTDRFYKELESYLPTLDGTLKYTHINLIDIIEKHNRATTHYKESKQSNRDISATTQYDTIPKNSKIQSTTPNHTTKDIESKQASPLPLLYKLFSPQVLLRQKSYIDANTLNQGFYNELLYILGLKEIESKGKVLIVASDTKNSLLDSIRTQFNLNTKIDSDFETAFSLLTTWNNRILFLRLLDSMLLGFKHIETSFLSLEYIPSFSMLNTLFFKVLAIKEESREDIEGLLNTIPYLNSSLFDKTELEKQNKTIDHIESNLIEIYSHSILKDKNGKLPLLEYLFAFLHAYSFTTTPKDIDNHTKTNHDKLINAAVLGLVFEKLNGYKEGSFYTPSFITSYMCKEALEKIVVEKFNALKGFECKDIESLRLKLDRVIESKEDYKEANAIFNSIRVCDPSVGSGHFLVSALNEMILLKHRLKILVDEDCNLIKNIQITLENDEIIIEDSNGKIFNYTLPSHENIESHKLQKALFNAKREIIESCLFGVDINENSCEITKLRLWIELLKYSYYKDIANKRLETLPNIDINIKCGNSLTAYMLITDKIHADIKNQIKTYQKLERDYFYCLYIDKAKHQSQIDRIKATILNTHFMRKYSKELEALRQKCEEYSKGYEKYGIENLSKHYDFLKHNVTFNSFFAGMNEIDETKAQEALVNLKKEHDKIFSLEKNFEWRIEFSKLLDNGLTQSQIIHNNTSKRKGDFKNLHKNNEGDFLGFDLIIGNPPYIRQEEIKHLKPHLSKAFSIYKGTSDIYTYFYEQGYNLLKENGILSYITSNKWSRAGYGEALRQFLLDKTSILSYTELNGIKVFENASVDTSILSFKKQKAGASHAFPYAHPKDYDPKSNKPLIIQEPQSIRQKDLSAESFTFSSDIVAKIKAKIEAKGVPLKSWDISINYGIKTGYNEAFIIDSATREAILESCASDDERTRTSALIKPVLRGRDIKRYSYEWAGLWIIGTFPALRLDIDEYPALKKYLWQFMPRLEQSGAKNVDGNGNNARKKTSNKWFETQDNIAYYEDFAKEKIVWNPVSGEYLFSYIKEELYFNNSLFMITDNLSSSQGGRATEASNTAASNDNHRLLYALGLLNSDVYKWLITQMTNLVETGKYAYGAKDKIERLPIPKLDSKLEGEFVAIVKEIIEARSSLRANEMSVARSTKGANQHSQIHNVQSISDIDCHEAKASRNDDKIKALESKLNQKVLSLFDFTKEELEYIYIYITISLLWIIALHSKRQELFALLSQSFENEIKEALFLVPNLKMPTSKTNYKISWQRVTQEPSFIMESDFYLLDSMAFMTSGSKRESLYLLGFLNSKAVFCYFKNIGHLYSDKGFLLSNQYVERFPIPKIDSKNRSLADEIISLVEQILESKKQDSNADTKGLESQIDSLVYQLYGLNHDEIMIIQNKG